jgi:hypothetical protein
MRIFPVALVLLPALALPSLSLLGGRGSEDPAADEAPVPAVGEPAPAFRLNDHTGSSAAVGGEREDGKWTVVAFYPKAMTPG